MKRLLVCDTPFQTLNALNIQWNTVHGAAEDKPETDLFIVNQFPTAKDLSERIAVSGLFRGVRLITEETTRRINKKLWRHATVALDYLRPRTVVKRYMQVRRREVPANAYDQIMSAVLSHFVSALLTINPKAQFDLFDDGTGSYSGDIVKKGSAQKYEKLARFLSGGRSNARPGTLYVNNVSYCKSTAADKIDALPTITEEFLDFACQVFDTDTNENGEKPIIYLTQPYPAESANGKNKRLVAERMKPYCDEVLVRMHPRDTDRDIYEGYEIDAGKNMWELISARGDIESKVLVSVFSGAQITPKMIFDKEPWLVFTGKIGAKEDRYPGKGMIQQTMGNYRHPEKIFVPANAEEFDACMEKIRQEIKG